MAIATSDFDYVRTVVRERSAIVLDPGKEYLVESRLAALARTLELGSVDELVAKLRTGTDVVDRVVEAMATNETSFFRDMRPFAALRTDVLPDLVERHRADRSLDIWSAGCSSGQEPYTIAMTILEHFPELASWNLRMLATDLSHELIARARTGSYSQIEVNRGLPSALLVKYFDRNGARWTVKPELQRRIHFEQLNLIDAWPPMRRLDVVFLRNVLVSFDVDTKARVLDRVHQSLAPDGYLFLGDAESTLDIHDGFQRLPYERAGCYRRTTGA
jgi:chemotaxis protein methyltransferase CheR